MSLPNTSLFMQFCFTQHCIFLLMYFCIHCALHSLITWTSLLSDRTDNDGAGNRCEPARGGVGGNPGVGDHPAAHVWGRFDWHEESG